MAAKKVGFGSVEASEKAAAKLRKYVRTGKGKNGKKLNAGAMKLIKGALKHHEDIICKAHGKSAKAGKCASKKKGAKKSAKRGAKKGAKRGAKKSGKRR
jgi:hypothetical protein